MLPTASPTNRLTLFRSSFCTNHSEGDPSTKGGPEVLSSGSKTLPLFTSAEEAATTVNTINTEQPSFIAYRHYYSPAYPRFVGNGNPDVCTFATVFALGQGRLFEEITLSLTREKNSNRSHPPLLLLVVPSPPSVVKGVVLRFSNPSLPGGRASFCQTPSDGQVYITYSSRPSGCAFVTLTVYKASVAERCIDGKIDGLDTTTDGFT
ncbi:unnamed protein product [Fusarium langsethiae]|nr:unnamed protein product [Fusarium langsethiae]